MYHVMHGFIFLLLIFLCLTKYFWIFTPKINTIDHYSLICNKYFLNLLLILKTQSMLSHIAEE